MDQAPVHQQQLSSMQSKIDMLMRALQPQHVAAQVAELAPQQHAAAGPQLLAPTGFVSAQPGAAGARPLQSKEAALVAALTGISPEELRRHVGMVVSALQHSLGQEGQAARLSGSVKPCAPMQEASARSMKRLRKHLP